MRAVTTRAPALLTPTITWPRTRESAPGTGSAPVTIAGATGPMPVTKTRTTSPWRAGFCKLTKVPSGRTTTARRAPSLMTVSKMPGLAAATGKLIVAGPPPALLVMGTLFGGGGFTGNLEGELFHGVHVAHAVNGCGDIIHRDCVGSQCGGPGTEGIGIEDHA